MKTADEIIWESGPARELHISDYLMRGDLLVRDVWRPEPDSVRDIFSTSAFADVLFRRRDRMGEKLLEAAQNAALTKALVLGKASFVAQFSVFVQRVADGDQVCLMGDCEQLGNWNAQSAIPMADTDAPVWKVSVALPPLATVNYKFVIRRQNTVIVQDVTDRCLQLNQQDKDYLSRSIGTAPIVLPPAEAAFRFPTQWKGAGLAIPVFSLRSKNGCGVGEFNDLIALVDFCVETGYQLLQLLPINDTTANNGYKDTYPYSAVSSFALHPQYLNIESLGNLPSPLQKEYNKERDRLNALPEVDYIQVMAVKSRFIREMYKIHKDEFLDSRAFKAWFDENQDWLVPYALFRFFTEVNGSSNFDKWGTRSSISADEIRQLASPDTFHFEYLAVVYYTQYHLHRQLEVAAGYAADHQVIFKGDLPIGVNRYGVDAWVNPHLFRLTMQSGAPPDFFSTDGQNWLFPTYDWDAMKKDNYGWWRARLGAMAKYFHAYRIDHILGFFRIWEIPESFRTGMSGRFFPAHAITRQELEGLGLWDIDRYIKPYVKDHILQQVFQEDWWKIKERFFEPLWDRLKFKEKYKTEKKVEKALELAADAPPTEREYNEKVVKKLFVLFNNVCLVQDVADENMFHPRFLMQNTSSFGELSDQWKSDLLHLYEDYFKNRQDELWKQNGLERLPMMKSASNMLVCGEDLGFVPDCVPIVMKQTSILSLAVQRMPADDVDFGIASSYDYECVATTSSHDTSTFRGWWEEMAAEERHKYWTQVMNRDAGSVPPAECSTEIVEWAVGDHLASPAMWAIFPIQDLLGMDKDMRRKDSTEEQINNPANAKHIWKFRLHVTIEEMSGNSMLVARLAKLNKDHRRGAAY